MLILSRPTGPMSSSLFFFFNDTATTEIYTLSLHDALPISAAHPVSPARFPGLLQLAHAPARAAMPRTCRSWTMPFVTLRRGRSEEHTSELQSHLNLVCRLLLEKKKNTKTHSYSTHTTT